MPHASSTTRRGLHAFCGGDQDVLSAPADRDRSAVRSQCLGTRHAYSRAATGDQESPALQSARRSAHPLSFS